ncbi:MAG: efflux RND transporter permease subunit [Desulfobacterales bacterium]|nr:efflux RND transporter permease subunit [Desulfobacterales bacterium]
MGRTPPALPFTFSAIFRFASATKPGVTELPPGYYITWGGQFENQQRAMAKLMIIAPVAVGLILLLLFATFRSVRLALLVILNLPFALIGGVFSLWLSGLYLSVPARYRPRGCGRHRSRRRITWQNRGRLQSKDLPEKVKGESVPV